MTVAPFRLIESRSEWDSVARLAPSIYHLSSWTLMSVRRIRRQVELPVGFGYARIWSGDTLIGCPLIRVGVGWFNTPRAAPAVLRGPPIDAAEALAAASPDTVTLYDDSDIVARIMAASVTVTGLACRTRTQQAVTRRGLEASLGDVDRTWLEVLIGGGWLEELEATCRASSWTTTIREHRDGTDRIVGWTVWVDAAELHECVAAVAVGGPVHGWSCPRDVSQPPVPSRHARTRKARHPTSV